MAEPGDETFDYVVVGSGAGGGTVAARLAEAGMKVLVLEAGADPAELKAEGLPEDYDVPAFHPFASENKAMAWNFRVHDFGDDAKRQPGPDATGRKGVLYPRASTLGGCTAHNAMILMVPHDSDWNAIAEITGDRSWRAEKMQGYFQRIENCRYRPLWRLLSRATGGQFNPTGHGWNGWLATERPLPLRAFGDYPLMCVIRDAVRADLLGEPKTGLKRVAESLARFFERKTRFVVGEDDPNDQRLQGRLAEGLTAVPLSTRRGRRRGARERVQAAMDAHGLRVEFDALATKVLFDERRRAIGVEYMKGRSLYRACPNSSREDGLLRRAFAGREVILAGGALNTPQLLMLSGVGSPDELAKHEIATLVPLDGVGRNLQDRYEIGVAHKTRRPWACLESSRIQGRRSRLSRMATRSRHVSLERRSGRVFAAVESRRNRPGSLRHGAPDAILWLLLRILGRHPSEPRRPDVCTPESAHRQPRRTGHLGVGKSPRPSRHRLPRLRRRDGRKR